MKYNFVRIKTVIFNFNTNYNKNDIEYQLKLTITVCLVTTRQLSGQQ